MLQVLMRMFTIGLGMTSNKWGEGLLLRLVMESCIRVGTNIKKKEKRKRKGAHRYNKIVSATNVVFYYSRLRSLV